MDRLFSEDQLASYFWAKVAAENVKEKAMANKNLVMTYFWFCYKNHLKLSS
jgi:hypothetical protein